MLNILLVPVHPSSSNRQNRPSTLSSFRLIFKYCLRFFFFFTQLKRYLPSDCSHCFSSPKSIYNPITSFEFSIIRSNFSLPLIKKKKIQFVFTLRFSYLLILRNSFCFSWRPKTSRFHCKSKLCKIHSFFSPIIYVFL